MLKILLLNTLYLLALVSTQKDESFVSLYVFVFWSRDVPSMVMTTKTDSNLSKNKHGLRLNLGY